MERADPLSILLVEDDPVARHLLERELGARGHAVTSCPDGETAWVAAQRGRFGLVVLDWVLPGMDGLELCRRIRGTEAGQSSVVLMVTSRQEPQDLEAVLDAGADDYLAKPLHLGLFRIRLTVAERQVKAGAVRRQAEEDLIRERALLERVMETSPVATLLMDAAGIITFANGRAEEVLGLPRAEIRGRAYDDPAWHITGPGELPLRDQEQPFRKVSATGRPVYGERHWVERQDGTRRLLSVSSAPAVVENGRVVTTVTTVEDVTASVEAEGALRRSEQRYRDLFERMLDGFALHELVRDEEGRPVDYRFLSVNPAFERLTGLRADEVIGRTVLAVLPDTEPVWIQTYGRVALTGEPAHFEHVSEALGRSFQVTAFCPAPGQFAVLFADVTDQRRAEARRAELEKQLRQAQKMEVVGTLAGGIAHDFNNILTPIMAHAELGLLQLGSDSPVRRDLESLLRAAERARDLVRQILSISRMDDGERVAVGVGPLVKEALALLRASLPATIEIREEIDPDCGALFADPTQLHQIVLNLCANARDAMREDGGILTVGLRRDREEGATVTLTVVDTGTGISPAALERIFDPYFTTKAPGEGTGLGLAVVHGIVRTLGGEISARSEPGKGTAFDVTLPACSPPRPPGTSASPPLPRGDRERILLVDDEPMIVDVGTEVLRSLGYVVTAEGSPEKALELFRADPDGYDLLVTDQTMPRLTGLQLMYQVLALRPRLPVLLCTGHSERVDARQAREAGARALVMKPWTRTVLAAAVADALESKVKGAASPRGAGP